MTDLGAWIDQRIAAGEGERFLVATVSRDGRVIGLDHATDADWNEVRAAHVALRDHLNERLANEERCPHRPADVP